MLRTYLFSVLVAASLAAACSTATFDTIYDPYDSCAARCLACKDADYVGDFANNCNYAKGDCCLSKFHDTITATWACARKNCDNETAQRSFDIFAKFCSERNTPIAAADIPAGYRGSQAAPSGTCDEHPSPPDAKLTSFLRRSRRYGRQQNTKQRRNSRHRDRQRHGLRYDCWDLDRRPPLAEEKGWSR
jgi:hypothetical protein